MHNCRTIVTFQINCETLNFSFCYLKEFLKPSYQVCGNKPFQTIQAYILVCTEKLWTPSLLQYTPRANILNYFSREHLDKHDEIQNIHVNKHMIQFCLHTIRIHIHQKRNLELSSDMINPKIFMLRYAINSKNYHSYNLHAKKCKKKVVVVTQVIK